MMREIGNEGSEKRPFRLGKKNTKNLIRWGTHLGSLIPLLRLYWLYSTDNLGADPVREILFFTGITGLVLLVLSLAITPFNILFGLKQLTPTRKLFGLYGFLYICLHLLTWLWFDYGFNWQFIQGGILKQRFVLVGFAAWLILVPLAITSNKWSQKKLGKRWSKLHKLTYVVIVLALIHFFWLVKNVYIEPTVYAVIVGVLLLTRVPPIRQYLIQQRRKLLKR